MVLMLSRSDIKSLITMDEAIDALKKALAEFSSGDAAMPVRSVILAPEHAGWFGIMPAYLPGSAAMGLKSVTVYKNNPGKGLPVIMGLNLLLDPTTGEPISVMDAGFLTAVRTAAASGLATDLLARPEARELALIGAGVQGRQHLVAITTVRPIEKVRVFDVSHENAERFRQEMQPSTQATIAVVASSEEAVRGADVIVTTSTATTPVVEYGWLKPGAHINGVGSHSPGVRELATEVVTKSRVVVDSREAGLKEAGDLQMPIQERKATPEQFSDELGEVVAGTKPGRASADQITLYKSVGIAVQDMAVAALVYRKAVEKGIGTEVDLLS